MFMCKYIYTVMYMNYCYCIIMLVGCFRFCLYRNYYSRWQKMCRRCWCVGIRQRTRESCCSSRNSYWKLSECLLFPQRSELCCRSEPWGRSWVRFHRAALTPSSPRRPPTQRNIRWEAAGWDPLSFRHECRRRTGHRTAIIAVQGIFISSGHLTYCSQKSHVAQEIISHKMHHKYI